MRSLDAFRGVKRAGDGWTAKCPAHHDQRNSLSIGTGEGGRYSLLVTAQSAKMSPNGLRELRKSSLSIKEELVININQPGRFTTIEQCLPIHIRERRHHRLMLGIIIDYRHYPKEI